MSTLSTLAASKAGGEHLPEGILDRLLEHYESMLRIRLLEEEVARLRGTGDIIGSVHLCNGQEAVYVGAAAALDPRIDAVFPTYRGHGWAVAMGVPPKAILAELLGRASGISGGRGGSAYFTAPAYGFYGENSIVGAAAPIATGSALAASFAGSKRISVASFGDGALNQGAVHEAMNFAAIRRLPVLFLVENNSYSEMTPTSLMVRDDRLFKRAQIYGFSGARVDGNDPEAMRQAVTLAKRELLRGNGPVLLEAITARIVGHYIGDAQHYRPAGEVDNDLEREPLRVITERMLGLGVPASAIALVSDRVAQEIEAASAAALADPMADPKNNGEHLYE